MIYIYIYIIYETSTKDVLLEVTKSPVVFSNPFLTSKSAEDGQYLAGHPNTKKLID